jgi:hypothetical protein
MSNGTTILPEITITRSAQAVSGGADSGNALSYAYEVVATGAIGFPATGNAIFRMFQRPANPNTPNVALVGDYKGVATPTDLATLGVATPLPGSYLYLSDRAYLVFTDQNTADASWHQMQDDVQNLTSALTEQGLLSVVDSFTASGYAVTGGISGTFGPGA